MEIYTRFEPSQQIPPGEKIQNGGIKTIRTSLDWGMGHVHRFQGCLLPYTHTKPIKKM